jgi:hypothetical protein
MKLLKLIPAIYLFSSCGNNGNELKTNTVDSSVIADTVFTPIANPDSSYEVVNTKRFYVWEVDIEKKTLKKNPSLATVAINADSVIDGLNRQYENILLEKINIHKDTINLKISDSDYLTNQIGSGGASQYIAQAVINLTSVPGIKYVHIDFKEGSHAEPDTWSRKDFPGYIIIH